MFNIPGNPTYTVPGGFGIVIDEPRPDIC
jgi:hypothetical protein